MIENFCRSYVVGLILGLALATFVVAAWMAAWTVFFGLYDWLDRPSEEYPMGRLSNPMARRSPALLRARAAGLREDDSFDG